MFMCIVNLHSEKRYTVTQTFFFLNSNLIESSFQSFRSLYSFFLATWKILAAGLLKAPFSLDIKENLKDLLIDLNYN